MLSLDDMVVKQKELVNKGYELDNIKCAAMLLIAERLGEVTEKLDILLQPSFTIDEDGTHRNASGRALPKIGPLPTIEETIEKELEETNGDD